jgi:hypothetical protein
MRERQQFVEAAMIAAMQALINYNPNVSCKFAAKKAQKYAEELAILQYGEYNNQFPDKVV